jgi:hypothetical protein
MAYWYYAMCHNLKPFKLDNENPLFILYKKIHTFLNLPHVLVYIVEFYGNIRLAYNSIHMVKYLLTIDLIHTYN